MNDILYTVHVDGTDKKFKKGTTYQEIARTYQQEYQHDIVLVFVDGRLQELFKTLETDCELKFVTTADPLGYKSYRRSMSLMLVKAIYDVAEHKNIDKVRIHYSVSKGYYCTIEGNIDLTQEFLWWKWIFLSEKKACIQMMQLQCSDSMACTIKNVCSITGECLG